MGERALCRAGEQWWGHRTASSWYSIHNPKQGLGRWARQRSQMSPIHWRPSKSVGSLTPRHPNNDQQTTFPLTKFNKIPVLTSVLPFTTKGMPVPSDWRKKKNLCCCAYWHLVCLIRVHPYHCHWARYATKLEVVSQQPWSKASCIYPERGPSSWTTLSFNFPIYEISRFDGSLRVSFCHQMLWPCYALTFWSLWPHRITILLHRCSIPAFIQTMVKTTSLVLAQLPVSKTWHGTVEDYIHTIRPLVPVC